MSLFALASSAIGIGLIDSSDPIAYTLIFKIFTTKKTIRNFIYFIIPYFVLVFILGNVFFFLGASLIKGLEGSLENTNIIFYILGGLLIILGVVQFFLPKKKKKEKAKKWKFKLEGIYCSLSALLLLFINIPLFVLYAGLILAVIQAGITFPSSLVIILVYSLTLITPYVLVAILYKKYEEKIRKILDKVFNTLGNKYVFGTLLILIGLYLIAG